MVVTAATQLVSGRSSTIPHKADLRPPQPLYEASRSLVGVSKYALIRTGLHDKAQGRERRPRSHVREVICKHTPCCSPMPLCSSSTRGRISLLQECDSCHRVHAGKFLAFIDHNTLSHSTCVTFAPRHMRSMMAISRPASRMDVIG